MSDRATPASDPARPLAGKVVLVAGPDSALASRLAHAAAERGARAALAPAAAAAHGPPAGDAIVRFALPLDTESAADELFDAAIARLERVDVLILIVAAEPLGPLHEAGMEGWRRAVSDPLRRLFWLARRAAEEFLASGAGRLVIVLEPAPGGERNEVLEDALRSFARSFAREYGRRSLACNLVLPGAAPAAAVAERRPDTAIVEHALFLASEAASFVTGEMLVVGSR